MDNLKIGCAVIFIILIIILCIFGITIEYQNEENDKNELYLKKVDYDLDEDINVPVGFKKVGNIYDLIFDTNDERDNK